MRSALTSTLLLAALVAVPLASAQTPTYSVTIQNAPETLTALGSNATSSVTFQVVLAIENVICTTAVTVPVAITATAAGAPGFFSVTPEPAVLNITISQGPHPQGSPGGGTGDVTLTARTTEVTANATIPITVTADAPAPAGAPTGCQGAGTVSAASAEPVTVTATTTAPPPPPAEEPPADDGSFLPGPGALMGILAAVGASMLLRRRA